MGTATRGARLLAVLSSLGAAVVFAPVAWADFAGGGSPKSDCYVVYEGLTINKGKNKSECTDGDPTCDTDGQCQGTCSFGITACFNSMDVAGCTPSNVTAVTVNGATLNLPTLPTSESICGNQSIVAVPTKTTAKGAKKGKLAVKVKATSVSKPKKDPDKFTLFCLPREGECPPPPSTTTTTLPTTGACCGLPGNTDVAAGFMAFATTAGTGNCGSYDSASGTNPIACGGLYFGGGGNAVPLPVSLPDQGTAVSKITACTGTSATVGAATSAETGSNLNCTDTGCFFGAPLAVPNPSSTPTSTCVLNQISAAVTGTVDCANGMSDLAAPLSSLIFLTGDKDGTLAGIQPCPICSNGTCLGGPNNGMTCVAGTTALNASYPTSHDCPPDPMDSIGSLPISFSLTSGTVAWTGSIATNDTGSTLSTQNRVFAGFCRDKIGTGAFANPAEKCWENGMAVGAACTGQFQSCEQRDNGAFGPAGGANSTITVIGTSGGNLSDGPQAGTLASIFGIPPTFNETVDAAGNLPGPGAVALPGTASLCADAMDCP
jgi:hypothetical protein